MLNILLLTIMFSAGEYETANEARKHNAIIMITQDNCKPCLQQQQDLIGVLAETGFLYDSQLIVVSVNREPQLANILMGGKMNSMRGYPHTIVFRQKTGHRYGWRYFGYQGRAHFKSWLIGVRNWKPPVAPQQTEPVIKDRST